MLHPAVEALVNKRKLTCEQKWDTIRRVKLALSSSHSLQKHVWRAPKNNWICKNENDAAVPYKITAHLPLSVAPCPSRRRSLSVGRPSPAPATTKILRELLDAGIGELLHARVGEGAGRRRPSTAGRRREEQRRRRFLILEFSGEHLWNITLKLGRSAPLFHRFNRQWIPGFGVPCHGPCGKSPSLGWTRDGADLLLCFVCCYWVLAESGLWTCWSLKSVVTLVLLEEIGWTEVRYQGKHWCFKILEFCCGRLRTWFLLWNWWIFAASPLDREIIQWVVDRDMFSALVSLWITLIRYRNCDQVAYIAIMVCTVVIKSTTDVIKQNDWK
jgi:hypothetical protein